MVYASYEQQQKMAHGKRLEVSNLPRACMGSCKMEEMYMLASMEGYSRRVETGATRESL